MLDDFDDIFVAAGSVGTACGLAIGNYLTGSKLRYHYIERCFLSEELLCVQL